MRREEFLATIDEFDVERAVTTAMVQVLGVPAHLKGYHYLRTAICMNIGDPEIVVMITKTLYPEIARMYKTTDQKVERAIRNAVEVSWIRRDPLITSKIFGPDRDVRPTNSEYIAGISDYVYMLLKEQYINSNQI